jgi:hypothetical protein
MAKEIYRRMNPNAYGIAVNVSSGKIYEIISQYAKDWEYQAIHLS